MGPDEGFGLELSGFVECCGSGNDTIYGHGRSDELRGMGGDDRLVDGRGNDFICGGEGADVFEFIADGRKDYIMDFEIWMGLIDLHDVPMLHQYSEN
ncbi:MAG: hypothetical protein ABGW81_01230, partial [Paracoccaceae bacterium]